MASLQIISSRNDDNSTTLTVTLPARRNGEVNFGALARINQTLLVINPDAFDPQEPPTLTNCTVSINRPLTETGTALAQAQYDAAEAPNPLNVGDAIGPGEA
jgi:hypothetical protein